MLLLISTFSFINFFLLYYKFQAWCSDNPPPLCSFECWESLSRTFYNIRRRIWFGFCINYGSGLWLFQVLNTDCSVFSLFLLGNSFGFYAVLHISLIWKCGFTKHSCLTAKTLYLILQSCIRHHIKPSTNQISF